MFSNRLAFGALALACVSAAAGGSYLATRHAIPASTVSAAVSPEAPAQPVDTPGAAGAAVGPVTSASPAEPNPEPRSAAAARTVQQPRRPAAQPEGNRTTAAPARIRSAGPVTAQPSAVEHAPAAPPAELPAAPVPLAFGTTPAGQDGRWDSEPARDAVERETLEELVVAADSVIGLQLEGGLTSEHARVEDAVEARVIRDVRVDRQVAIPAGSRALGSVMLVERGGRLKDRARLGITFHTLVLADGTRLPIATGTIYRYGDAPSDRSAKKIGGGAVAGAILGAIVGGARGAAVGATAGAGGGTAMVMAGERSPAEFPPGTEVTARILDPVAVVVTQR